MKSEGRCNAIKKNSLLTINLIFLLIIPLYYSPVKGEQFKNSNKDKTQYNILIDLNERTLYVINKTNNEIVKSFPVASGKPETPSPIGTWTIISKGEWTKWFGTRWMGLNVPWGKYGIHGTNRPGSIGRHASHGCIRMFNRHVEEVYDMVDYGSTVVIYGGPYNMYSNEFRCLTPGDSGFDVLEVQRQLTNIGYYTGNLDGKYGEGMKSQVIKFRKDKHLELSHFVDKSFYRALNMYPFE